MSRAMRGTSLVGGRSHNHGAESMDAATLKSDFFDSIVFVQGKARVGADYIGLINSYVQCAIYKRRQTATVDNRGRKRGEIPGCCAVTGTHAASKHAHVRTF